MRMGDGPVTPARRRLARPRPQRRTSLKSSRRGGARRYTKLFSAIKVHARLADQLAVADVAGILGQRQFSLTLGSNHKAKPPLPWCTWIQLCHADWVSHGQCTVIVHVLVLECFACFSVQ